MDDPTLAAVPLDEGETQSIHAWSQEDADTDVVDYRPRSWKAPLLLAVTAAVAVVGAGAWTVWPQLEQSPHQAAVAPSAAKPQVAPPAKVAPRVSAPPPVAVPPKPESKNDVYVRLLHEHGIPTGPAEAVGAEGRGICYRINHGETEAQMVRDVMAGTPGISSQDAWIWVDTAIEVYCS
jgi:hypothetical protein